MDAWDAYIRELRPGDHIITSRKGDVYDHHGIYEGNNRVIHFQAPLKVSPTGFVYPLCKICQYVHPREGGLVRSCLTCFHKCESLCVIRYRKRIPWEMRLDSVWKSLRPGKVIYGYQSKKIYLELFKPDGELLGHLKISEKESLSYAPNFCIRLSRLSCTRSAEEVINAACRASFGKYNLIFNNCEDFAVYCKTGKARSFQAEKKFKGIGIPFVGKLFYTTIKCVDRYFGRKKMKKKLREYLASR